jgi:hypothetical protein
VSAGGEGGPPRDGLDDTGEVGVAGELEVGAGERERDERVGGNQVEERGRGTMDKTPPTPTCTPILLMCGEGGGGPDGHRDGDWTGVVSGESGEVGGITVGEDGAELVTAEVGVLGRGMLERRASRARLWPSPGARVRQCGSLAPAASDKIARLESTSTREPEETALLSSTKRAGGRRRGRNHIRVRRS